MEFVGRQAELAALEAHYATGRFEMVVVYGRRRLGKTALCRRFSQQKRCLFFTALEKSDVVNLRNFSAEIGCVLGLEGMPSFDTWSAAFTFLAKRGAQGDPLLVVIDEFPYAARANPALPSMLQVAIDRDFSKTDMTLVLCGSNQGFMESEVLGSKSPLFGRRTCQMKLEPFDLAQASLMLPALAPCDLIECYAAFGGTPYYLSLLDGKHGYRHNAARLVYDPFGILFREPEMMLRQELNEPALYVSVLDAVAGGATRQSVIADKAGVAQSSVGKYLSVLESLGVLERAVPFGEDPRKSRRGSWRVKDPFFAYWFRFVSPYVAAVESGAGVAVLDQTASGEPFDAYVGMRFEDICMQWVKRRNAQGDLGFLATRFGKWWGSDPSVCEQADIDVVASDARGSSMLFGECKWRNSFDETEAVSVLEHRAGIIGAQAKRTYALFTKHPASAGTRKKARSRDDLMLVSAEELAK